MYMKFYLLIFMEQRNTVFSDDPSSCIYEHENC